MQKYNVVSVGSGLVDAFVGTDFKEVKAKIFFPIGTKILVDKMNFSIGGGGVNSAICFSNIGLKAGFLGKIGSGYNGRIILRELKKNNVDFLGVKANEHTGYSIILESDKKNRTILTFKGVSDNMKLSEISLEKFQTNWFYLTSLGGESFRTQKKIVTFARKKGINIAYNPSSYHTRHGASYLKDLLKHTYVLSLNKEEALMLVKTGDLYKGLRQLGPRIVCITDGENEGIVYDGNFLYRYYPHKVKVREATGAGDIFGSSFVTGLIKLKDIEGAIKIAMAHAETAICALNKNNRLLSWHELERIIKSKAFKVKREVHE